MMMKTTTPKTHRSPRRRTRLDALTALAYEYRHEIAYGLMVAAALLKSWHRMDLTPMKQVRGRVVRTTKPKPRRPSTKS